MDRMFTGMSPSQLLQLLQFLQESAKKPADPKPSV